MKRPIVTLLLLALTLSPLCAKGSNEMSDQAAITDSIYRTGAGALDGAFTSISSSMLGWGVGLTAGIALLTAALHQSKASSHHAHSD